MEKTAIKEPKATKDWKSEYNELVKINDRLTNENKALTEQSEKLTQEISNRNKQINDLNDKNHQLNQKYLVTTVERDYLVTLFKQEIKK